MLGLDRDPRRLADSKMQAKGDPESRFCARVYSLSNWYKISVWSVAARDLEVSLGDILEHLFFERQRRQRASELRVFLLQILQLLGLFYLQATVLLPPPVEGLIGDPDLFAGQRHGLALAYQHFDLPQLGDDLLRRERFLRHFPDSFLVLKSLVSTGTKKPGQVIALLRQNSCGAGAAGDRSVLFRP